MLVGFIIYSSYMALSQAHEFSINPRGFSQSVGLLWLQWCTLMGSRASLPIFSWSGNWEQGSGFLPKVSLKNVNLVTLEKEGEYEVPEIRADRLWGVLHNQPSGGCMPPPGWGSLHSTRYFCTAGAAFSGGVQVTMSLSMPSDLAKTCWGASNSLWGKVGGKKKQNHSGHRYKKQPPNPAKLQQEQISFKGLQVHRFCSTSFSVLGEQASVPGPCVVLFMELFPLHLPFHFPFLCPQRYLL